MRILNAKLHGIIDYAVVVFLWLSPTIFGLSEFVSLITYAIGGIHLLLTALTDFEYGLVKLIPLRIHGRIELLVSMILIPAPWILGFDSITKDTIFYIGFGASVFLTWLLTDYGGRQN